ncbi:MBL fold metallo-hydrolase [Flagellimonas nanhaiensis]|uniref:MBL fold metallo-hydrolase n=1 Tax=Flagellimonas nanhaiensis TaxID=2292706 RepID=A0A371JSH9_9FLAO|nr:MBL fold metallo-hydrolase [Allomuricauda nanhaiensis]RDY60764.1 MBL fold metallo-hydrolase [Allomuricauda nanhaiensis]
MLIYTLVLIGILILAYFLFVNFNPSFGGDVSDERKQQYASSKQFGEGIFKNTEDVPKDPSFSELLTMTRKFFFSSVENGRPGQNLSVEKIDSTSIADYTSQTRLIWFGHSSFLLQINSKNILIDPMLGDVPAPHPWLGGSRFNKELPIAIEKLPKIDAVLISHDHYDHLDYESIQKLKDKVGKFYVPLGVGVHLESWNVPKDAIMEMDWWQDTYFDDLQFVCTPAQHFSGRKFNNRQSTLWSSWVILSESERIFFSGDSGYSPHFKEIGNIYGPFDFAMLECGQYNKMWPDIHMFPEETAQAGLDVKAKTIMPIHWGAFKLALHSWTDPIERVSKKARELQIHMISPKIGEPIILGNLNNESEHWWEQPNNP